MIRLLIVLAVVVLAAFYLNYGTRGTAAPTGGGGAAAVQDAGPAASPQAVYQQETGKARALEQQLQQQAQEQLDTLDAGTQ